MMYKKNLITALALCSCFVGLAQTNKPDENNRKNVAKTCVDSCQNDLLSKMQQQLKGEKIRGGVNFADKQEIQQFLYQEELIDSTLKSKSHTLRAVYDKLRKKQNLPTTLDYQKLDVKIGEIEYKHKKKRDQIDSSTLIVPMTFEVHTRAKEGVSDVKYMVSTKWTVAVQTVKTTTKVDGQKKRISTICAKGEPKLISSVANRVKFLTSDKESMKSAAQREIVKWYANLDQTLDKQYTKQSVSAIRPMNVSAKEIKMNLPNSSNFTVTDVPTIKVDVDPYQFISNEDKPLYTNPAAYIILAPTFNVSVGNSFKNAELSVSYVVKETVKPIADKEKELRRNTANAVIAELAKKLSNYVTSRDIRQKGTIEDMFDNARSNIEVSYLPKHGTEKIKTEHAHNYLSKLKGSLLNITTDGFMVVDPNWNSLVYTIDQKYQSNTYSDYTKKKVYLKYDSIKKTYSIDKIEVVPNSTKIK